MAKHAGGRPVSHQMYLNKSWTEPKIVGEIEIGEIFRKKNRFKSEREMQNYIIAHIKEFCYDILDDKYISHKTEYGLSTASVKRTKGVPNLRIDLYIKCEMANYAIELKNPANSYTEMVKAISQLMLYDMILTRQSDNAELILISSIHSDIYVEMLKHYNLKYKYILLNKTKSAELCGYKEVENE